MFKKLPRPKLYKVRRNKKNTKKFMFQHTSFKVSVPGFEEMNKDLEKFVVFLVESIRIFAPKLF